MRRCRECLDPIDLDSNSDYCRACERRIRQEDNEDYERLPVDSEDED